MNGRVTELADVWETSCKKCDFKIPSPSGCAGSTPARASMLKRIKNKINRIYGREVSGPCNNLLTALLAVILLPIIVFMFTSNPFIVFLISTLLFSVIMYAIVR